MAKLRKQMERENIEATYKENDLLKKELVNMEILLEENDELREEIERMKKLSFDDRQQQIGEENAQLRRRNG